MGPAIRRADRRPERQPLAAEASPPRWKLFAAQHKSYMQIIFEGAAIASILIGETFDNARLNLTLLVEVVLAVLVARGDLLTSFLGSGELTETQWLIAAIPAGPAVHRGGETGKAIARSRAPRHADVAPPAEPRQEALVAA